ncbi:hypothetical protein HY605_03625 [Candidatus Peregrinibacteria bacterium]|nr:hypothetical protein [Candidatus Peregrinibacteria bacterium]
MGYDTGLLLHVPQRPCTTLLPGFREKSHYALSIASKELFLDKLGKELVNTFENAMELRQEADYGLKFSEEGAIETIEGAEAFLAKAKALLKM